ncbi:MAG: hypothetical protein ACRDNZ_08255, partial [Streptosporangiaceae bacterium]
MATTNPSAALVPVAPAFTNTERLALGGFLAGYSGLTRQACELDLRQFVSWCQQDQLRLFQARRADIEFFARDLEARGPRPRRHHAPAVHSGRVLPIRGRGRNPRPLTRRPRPAAPAGLRIPRHRPGPYELGALLVPAGLGPPAEHALISLLALNGLRVSEATGADIEAMGVERGHRTLV